MNKISILIADDHKIVRMGLKSLFAAEKDLVVVGEGGDACWLYMAERDGTLAVFGLDVFAPVPEAKSRLDGIVDHLLK